MAQDDSDIVDILFDLLVGPDHEEHFTFVCTTLAHIFGVGSPSEKGRIFNTFASKFKRALEFLGRQG